MPNKSEKVRKIVQADREHTIQNGALCFLPGNRLPSVAREGGLIGTAKRALQKRPRLYNLLVLLVIPTIARPGYWKLRRTSLASFTEEDVLLNIGSGPICLHGRADFINVDLLAFDNVDIVADALDLPIRDGTVGFALSIATIEHVIDPARLVAEMHRVLRPGGTLHCGFPFIMPYHEAPADYYRWTISGAKELFASFGKVEVIVGAGPTGALLWIFQEWVAILFSFGFKPLHDILFLAVMLLTAPIKLLDLFMAAIPGSERIASGILVIAKK